MAHVALFKYLIISNNYFTMNGFTDKDAILVIFFANILIYEWQKFQPCQTSRSVFPLEIAYLVQKIIMFLSQVKILVVLHHLQKEWILFYLKWAWNECLHLKTQEMSISMGSSIVQWLIKKIIAEFALCTWSCPARALRALGLLLADGAPTVGRGKTIWQVSWIFYGNSCNSGTESRKIVPKVGN